MRAKLHKIKKKKSFKDAVLVTDEVKLCFREGKQAILNAERSKVELINTAKCGGSIFIDQCLFDQKLYPNANRWDYAIDYNGEVFFFEIHNARSGEVSTVLKKLDWLKDWLHSKAPEINSMKAKSPYYWIQSNGYHISKNSSHERNAIQNGLKPISKLVLK